ncbi:MAG: ATPase, T2SS/T4P/T4SS family [Bacilli bacterium]|jgi:pilus assembly protein CpaF
MQKAALLLEQSFLKPLLEDEQVTDITYNGGAIYFVSNEYGRSFYRVVEQQKIMNMLRQIANITNQQFSYQKPILDVSFANYRLSAVHPSIGRINYDDGCSFSLRIAPKEPLDLVANHMLDEKLVETLKELMNQKKSIVIAGATGVGKTELQKYLLSLLPRNERVILIDNVQELSSLQETHENLDLTVWELNDDKRPSSLKSLIKTALRFNPDYILIAESRGDEMEEIYNASLSGHPTILTLHSDTCEDVYTRIYQMCPNIFKTLTYKDALDSLKATYPIVIFLRKKSNEISQIIRFIEKIIVYKEGKKEVIYEKEEDA